MTHASSIEKIPIAISSCLLGQAVRYDGGHKHNAYLTETLGRYFDYTGFCPEVAIGLGIPRPAIQLVRIDDKLCVRGVNDPQLDVTAQLQAYANASVAMLAGYCGYIFKRASPSCGMECVKVYENGHLAGTDRGIYAAEIMQALPALPVEEEGRLMDPALRENFIERVFVYHRWQQFKRRGLSAAGLVEFHTRHKFSLLAHDETVYRELGQRLAEAGRADLEMLASEYVQRLMQALAKPATRKTHTNVLMHIMGYIKQDLTAEDKQELLQILDKYRLGQVPLLVPVTLLKHYLRHYSDEYIGQQVYLNPHPDELMLRNSL
jgi:uncharacterized protein YbgA (DUF1722 family)/uncharacterized protein YbbK (DUF523 family)